MEWTEEQYKRFEKFVLGDDMDFYEEYTIHLTDEEQKKGKCESLFVTDKELCYNIKVKVGVWPMDSLTITDRMIFSSENRDIAVRGNCCDLPNQF